MTTEIVVWGILALIAIIVGVVLHHDADHLRERGDEATRRYRRERGEASGSEDEDRQRRAGDNKEGRD